VSGTDPTRPDSAAPERPDTADPEVLRARVAQLETQLADQARATNVTVARAQEKLYWLERWHVDLDMIMRRRSAQLALELVRRARGAVRTSRKLKRRIKGR